MSKVKLSKAELAALDLLIATLENDNSVQSSETDSVKWVTAIARVAAVAVPAIVDMVAGERVKDSTDISKITDAKGNLSLDALLKLREETNK